MPKPNGPSQEQHDRFIETARQLECDEDEAMFKEKLGKIATATVAADKKNPRTKPRL